MVPGALFSTTSVLKKVPSMLLENGVKTVQTTDWSGRIATSATRDILHKPMFFTYQEPHNTTTQYTMPYNWGSADGSLFGYQKDSASVLSNPQQFQAAALWQSADTAIS